MMNLYIYHETVQGNSNPHPQAKEMCASDLKTVRVYSRGTHAKTRTATRVQLLMPMTRNMISSLTPKDNFYAAECRCHSFEYGPRGCHLALIDLCYWIYRLYGLIMNTTRPTWWEILAWDRREDAINTEAIFQNISRQVEQLATTIERGSKSNKARNQQIGKSYTLHFIYTNTSCHANSVYNINSYSVFKFSLHKPTASSKVNIQNLKHKPLFVTNERQYFTSIPLRYLLHYLSS